VHDVKGEWGIPGVSLMLESTKIGTAANSEGEFRIDSIPPGIYKLSVRTVGHFPVKIDDLIVRANEILKLDITMLSKAISDSDDPLINPRGPIDKYQTSNKTEMDAEDVETMPVSTMDDILNKTPGFLK
jgi:hypothetical protein